MIINKILSHPIWSGIGVIVSLGLFVLSGSFVDGDTFGTVSGGVTKSGDINNTVNNTTNNTVINNSVQSKVEKGKDILDVEWDGLIKDRRVNDKAMDATNRADASFTYMGGQAKKSALQVKKDKCELAVEVNRGSGMYHYVRAFAHDFKKNTVRVKSKKAQNIIKFCKTVSQLAPREPEYLYYVAIGYHLLSDYKNAIFYLNKAANTGSLDAKRKLGIIYLTGSILSENKVASKRLLLEAANHDDIASLKILENYF